MASKLLRSVLQESHAAGSPRLRSSRRTSTVHHGDSSHRTPTSNSSQKRRQPTRVGAADTVKLYTLGYRQELKRNLSRFHCFGMSLSMLSPLTAITGLYGSWGLTYGGPVVMVFGLPIVMLFSTLVATSLAEFSSAYPTSGALYYWSWALAPPRHRVLACWVTGWLQLLGQVAFTAVNTGIVADLISVMLLMTQGQELPSWSWPLIQFAVLVVAGLLCTTPNSVMSCVTTIATMWNMLALVALCVAMVALSPSREPASYVFLEWDQKRETPTAAYTVILGLLMSQYLFLGFDASAHVSEEVYGSDVYVPGCIISSSLAAGVLGYLYVLCLNWATVTPGALLDPSQAPLHGHNAVAQLVWDIHVRRFGVSGRAAGVGASALLSIPLMAAIMSVFQSVAANSRMLYAYSRDGALPFHQYISKVEKRTKAPVAGVWAMVLLSTVLCIPISWSTPYQHTIESTAIVNIYLSYGIPIAYRLLARQRRAHFIPGPFFLGPRASLVVNVLAVTWVGFVVVIFSLPLVWPITSANINYTPVATVGMLVLALAAYYLPKYGGAHWFTGPRPSLGRK